MKRKKTEQHARLGQLLKQIRKYRGIKAATLAHAIGVSESYYCRIEQGNAMLTFWEVVTLCEVLQCSIIQLSILLEIEVLRSGAIKK